MYATAKVGGNDSPATNTAQLVMPTAGTPTLTYASEKGSTTGCATAAPPLGTAYDECTFTFSPLDGSNTVTSKVTDYETCVDGLNPNTNYEVRGWLGRGRGCGMSAACLLAARGSAALFGARPSI